MPTMKPVLPAVLGLLLLAACEDHPPASAAFNPDPRTPTEQYRIDVAQAPAELKLAPHAAGLSETQRQALAALAERRRPSDASDITLKAPEGGADPNSTYRTVTEAREVLIGAGVAPEQVHIVSYAAAEADAPIVVEAMNFVARGPQCGQAWENLAFNFANGPYEQFGCAVTANIAAQVADPADLQSPRPSTDTDANRRQGVFDKYRAGMLTSSPPEPQAKATFSSAGQ